MENIYEGIREWTYGLEVSIEEFFEREEIQITLAEIKQWEEASK